MLAELRAVSKIVAGISYVRVSRERKQPRKFVKHSFNASDSLVGNLTNIHVRRNDVCEIEISRPDENITLLHDPELESTVSHTDRVAGPMVAIVSPLFATDRAVSEVGVEFPHTTGSRSVVEAVREQDRW